MGHCKDCRFWQKSYVRSIPGMYCDYSSTLIEELDSDWDIGCAVLDDSGLTTLLITKPMFGCVNFKGKTCEY